MHERPERANRFRTAATYRRDGGAEQAYRSVMPTTLPTELVVLTWGCILGFVHIFVATQAKTRQ